VPFKYSSQSQLSVDLLKNFSHSTDDVVLLINILAAVRVEVINLLEKLFHMLSVDLAAVG